MRIIFLLFIVACGAQEPCHLPPVCHPGNYRIVLDRYELCGESGQWEDWGPVL